MPEFRLLPNVEDASDIDTPEEPVEKLAPQEDRLAALEAELARERTLNKQQIEDLRRTAGRIQAALAKAEKAPTELNSALNEKFGSIYEQLAAIVDSADPTVFPDTLKKQLAKVSEDARRAADRDSLRAEVLRDLLPATTPPPSQPDDNIRVQTAIETALVAAGFESDDIDWAEADKEWLAKGEAGVMAYVRASIADLVTAREADTRRQSRKEVAPTTPAPTSGSAAEQELAKYLDPRTSFEERMKIHAKLVG